MCNFKRLVQTVSSAAFLFGYLFEKLTKTKKKIFKRNFMQKKQEGDRKDKVLQILVQFAGTYLRESSGNKVL